jgi:hypothetical protein
MLVVLPAILPGQNQYHRENRKIKIMKIATLESIGEIPAKLLEPSICYQKWVGLIILKMGAFGFSLTRGIFFESLQLFIICFRNYGYV